MIRKITILFALLITYMGNAQVGTNGQDRKEEGRPVKEYNLTIEENEIVLTYFPNPVSNILYINYINEINTTVFDINGRKILETDKKTIDFSDFGYGIYVLHIKDTILNNYKIIKILKE